jgi:hypothetical protein
MRRWLFLYLAIAFGILIPVVSYHVISEHQPKTILIFALPIYALFSWAAYSAFKKLSKTKSK